MIILILYCNYYIHSIGERYNREVKIVSVDFSQGQSVYDDIQAEISDLDVAVLGERVGVLQ